VLNDSVNPCNENTNGESNAGEINNCRPRWTLEFQEIHNVIFESGTRILCSHPELSRNQSKSNSLESISAEQQRWSMPFRTEFAGAYHHIRQGKYPLQFVGLMFLTKQHRNVLVAPAESATSRTRVVTNRMVINVVIKQSQPCVYDQPAIVNLRVIAP